MLSYFVLFTFIAPVTEDVGRYILPVIPFVGLAVSICLNDLNKNIASNKVLFISIPIFIVLYSFYNLIPISLHHRSRGLDFDTVVEKNIINSINTLAEKRSTVLIYEVQDRFYLREDIDVLSFDGIIDGKVAPYLNNSDMYSFIMKYKPKYWLANDAVYYRPYLVKSILNNVLNEVIGKNKCKVMIGSITFEKLLESNEERISGFASYRALFRLTYDRLF